MVLHRLSWQNFSGLESESPGTDCTSIDKRSLGGKQIHQKRGKSRNGVRGIGCNKRHIRVRTDSPIRCAILDRRAAAEKALIVTWSSTSETLSGDISVFMHRSFRAQMLQISGFDGGFSSQRTDNVDLPAYRIGMSRI